MPQRIPQDEVFKGDKERDGIKELLNRSHNQCFPKGICYLYALCIIVSSLNLQEEGPRGDISVVNFVCGPY